MKEERKNSKYEGGGYDLLLGALDEMEAEKMTKNMEPFL